MKLQILSDLHIEFDAFEFEESDVERIIVYIQNGRFLHILLYLLSGQLKINDFYQKVKLKGELLFRCYNNATKILISPLSFD